MAHIGETIDERLTDFSPEVLRRASFLATLEEVQVNNNRYENCFTVMKNVAQGWAGIMLQVAGVTYSYDSLNEETPPFWVINNTGKKYGGGTHNFSMPAGRHTRYRSASVVITQSGALGLSECDLGHEELRAPRNRIYTAKHFLHREAFDQPGAEERIIEQYTNDLHAALKRYTKVE